MDPNAVRFIEEEIVDDSARCMTQIVGIIVAITRFIHAVSLEIQEEDSDDEPDEPIPMADYLRLGNVTFQSHFRMLKATFEEINTAVNQHLVDHGGRLRPCKLPSSLQFLMAIWILATPDSFRSVASRFGVSKGTVHLIYRRYIKALRELAKNFIKWPTQRERMEISDAYYHLSHYPGVVGCIDGTHINITAPVQHPIRYINRKNDYSLILQGVCDNRLLFRDVYAGECGSLHDARVFRRSPLSQSLFLNGFLDDNQHLLGDGAYALRRKLIIPYKNNGHLAPWQINHNATLSSARVTIENAFGLLKGKWRRLKFLDVQRLDYAVDEIVASCVLHNHIILEGEGFGDEFEDGDELDEPENDDAEEPDDGGRDAGEEKRSNIAHGLPGYVGRNRH